MSDSQDGKSELETVLPKEKWSVVELDTPGEFDCLPNSWFVALDRAYYYPAGFSAATATRMAKNHDAPLDDWTTIPVTLKKRNYTQFDKGMEKAIAYTNNKGSQSESELKGKGLRKIKQTDRLSPSKFFSKKAAVKQLPFSFKIRSPKKICFERISNKSPSKQVVQQVSGELNDKQVVQKVSGESNDKQVVKQTSGQPSSSQKPSANEQCPLKKKGLKHKCAFDYGPASVVTLSQSICVLARLLEGLLSELNMLKELVQGLGQEDDKDDIIDSEDEGLQSILEQIPLFTVPDLLEFDKQLTADPTLGTTLQNYLKGKASTTNASICATSVMKCLISKSLCKNMVWKGKEGGPKIGFENLRLRKIVTKVVQAKFSLLPKQSVAETVKTSIKRWLSQTGSNIKQGRTPSDSPLKQGAGDPPSKTERGKSQQGASASPSKPGTSGTSSGQGTSGSSSKSRTNATSKRGASESPSKVVSRSLSKSGTSTTSKRRASESPSKVEAENSPSKRKSLESQSVLEIEVSEASESESDSSLQDTEDTQL